ncbi:MAG: hypothetical protein R6V44_11600 [Paracoccaceae bacterium]
MRIRHRHRYDAGHAQFPHDAVSILMQCAWKAPEPDHAPSAEEAD